MKGIELMTVSSSCTAVLTMEMSLPLISKKSEHDPAASSVGSQSLHFPMSRKKNMWIHLLFLNWLLLYLLPAAIPPPGWGHLTCMSLLERKECRTFREENYFLCSLGNTAPGWIIMGIWMTILPKGTSRSPSVYYGANWEIHMSWVWFLKKKAK